MKVDVKGKSVQIILTLQEAVLLKRVAWDGPDPTTAEQKRPDAAA